MKVTKVKIQNFRLLKEFELDCEKDLSLVIGKNNCGKTSLLSILEKFIGPKGNSPEFSFDDFNIEFQRQLKETVEDTRASITSPQGIVLKLFIQYEEADDLINISKVIMDLDPNNKTVVLKFEYVITPDDVIRLKGLYKDFRNEEIQKIDAKLRALGPITDEEKKSFEEKAESKKKILFYDFMKSNHKEFFTPGKKTVFFDIATGIEDDSNYINLDENNIKLDKIINFRVIPARRDMSNKDTDKTLSLLSSKYYEKRESVEKNSKPIKDFKDTLKSTDDELDKVYEGLFEKVVGKVALFGGIKKDDSVIKIISSLQTKELLKGNTTVMYDHNDEHSLPEHYNGLGYMNLIGMIFEIEVLITDFRKEYKETEIPADINLLFIEEPEAHTHPQMQYVFIKNIKNILVNASKGDGGSARPFNLQTIITTHSSHITAESNFDEIKYFTKCGANSVIAKNLKDLEKEYEANGEKENFRFLKQYLTLNRAELFFADKAIFIEGDTERILLPAMMKKLDQEESENPLLSQNVSIVEVGAYSHIFEKFIEFIGVKALIITDIDSARKFMKKDDDGKEKEEIEKCKVAEADASITTNASLIYFHSRNNSLEYYKELKFDYKILRKKKRPTPKWVSNRKGNLLIVYQTKESNNKGLDYHGRSFEDAFFHLNGDLLSDKTCKFESLTQKHLKRFLTEEVDVYEFCENAIGSKPSLAIEILMNSKTDPVTGDQFSNWNIPAYIKEGLKWLKKN